MTSDRQCEILSVVSGKGGSGKTLIAASLAYALQRAGLRVALLDADLATQGLSLFVLGPGGTKGTSRIDARHSLYHVVERWPNTKNLPVPKRVDRIDPASPALLEPGRTTDHTSYEIVISNRQFYDRRLAFGGSTESTEATTLLREFMAEATDEFRASFKEVMRAFADAHREKNEYDYIIIDTRGGFGEMSLIPTVFSDSFVLVAEPDFSTFHQLSKLLTNIDLLAMQENRNPYIRGVFVNKALDGEEDKFRALVSSQFQIEHGLTWAIPLDSDAVQSYKRQLVPHQIAPGSEFSFHLLSAFTEMLDIVTAEWPVEAKDRWHQLVNVVDQERHSRLQEHERERVEVIQMKDELKRLRMNEEAAKGISQQLDNLEVKVAAQSKQWLWFFASLAVLIFIPGSLLAFNMMNEIQEMQMRLAESEFRNEQLSGMVDSLQLTLRAFMTPPGR